MASSLGIRNNGKTMVKVSEPEFPAISFSFFFLSGKTIEHSQYHMVEEYFRIKNNSESYILVSL